MCTLASRTVSEPVPLVWRSDYGSPSASGSGCPARSGEPRKVSEVGVRQLGCALRLVNKVIKCKMYLCHRETRVNTPSVS